MNNLFEKKMTIDLFWCKKQNNKCVATRRLLEAISKIVFWFKISRRNSAGQERGGEFQPADILKYVEDLKRKLNADIGPKGIFEVASKLKSLHEERVIYA